MLSKISPISSAAQIHKLLQKSCYSFSKKSQSYEKGKDFPNLINFSVSEMFHGIVQKYPSNIAMNSYSQNVTFTYEQLYQKALSLATGLIKELKLKPKDRIGIYSYNKWEWYVVQLAASLADLILVNINPAYQSQQLSYTIDKVNLKVLFMSPQFKTSNYIDIVTKIFPEIKSDQKNDKWKLKVNKFNEFQNVVLMGGEKTENMLSFQELLLEPDRSVLPPYPSVYDAANIQFTSGTTGLPKAATLSHLNILNNGYCIGIRCGYTEKDNIALPVPLYHCFGMIMGNLGALTRGAAVTFIGQGFDGKKSMEAVTKYKATSLYGVPTMFRQYIYQLQKNPGNYDTSSLRTGIVAGALCPDSLMEQILDVLNMKEITNCYGMTETSPVSFQTSKHDSWHHRTKTVGSILDGLQAKIVNENDQIVERGQIGEFCMKGWAAMIGYWGDKQATEKTVKNGWVYSGDQGIMDQHGYLSIVGRIKDMIIRGGQNIYPKQIQEFIVKHQKILDIQIVSIPDIKFGEEVFAVIRIEPQDIDKISKQDIYEYCKGKIAHYKIPTYVKFIAEQFPMTVSGKPQKYIIRNQLKQEMDTTGIEKYRINKKK